MIMAIIKRTLFGPGYSDQTLLLECLVTNRNVVLIVLEAVVHSQGINRCWI